LTQKGVILPAESESFKIRKINSGIPGFDELLGGGIPEGNLVVLSGDPGSGKTVFCWQFLYAGASKYNEPGVYVSLEESEEAVLKGTKEFGMDFEPLIRKGMILIVTIDLYDFDRLKSSVEDAIRSVNAKRVVIDPGVIFRLFFEKGLDARKNILALGKMFGKIGCTTVITNELNIEKGSSLYGLEEYVADGVVIIYHTRMKNHFVRSIGVLKMRNTEIVDQLKPIKITGNGIKVLAKSELFSDIE
jgi:KaiC/GvpD/RAD55 family RecA-like ATPase